MGWDGDPGPEGGVEGRGKVPVECTITVCF